MLRRRSAIVALMACVVAAMPDLAIAQSATVLRVDQAAAPGGDGVTWATALDSLESALDRAAEIVGDDDTASVELWLKSDTYVPDGPPPAGDPPYEDARDDTFRLVAKTLIYGGFTGSETLRAQRDPELNPTILSGERGDPGWEDDFYTVVDARQRTTYIQSSRYGLSGVHVVGGSATGDVAPPESSGPNPTQPRWSGGGLYMDTAINGGDDPLFVVRCRFEDNRAKIGGGIYVQQVSEDGPGPTPTGTYRTFFSSCTITDNHTVVCDPLVDAFDVWDDLDLAAWGGGGVAGSRVGSIVVLQNCLIHHNTAADYDGEVIPAGRNGGGGVLASRASFEILGCTIVENEALAAPGAGPGEGIPGGGVVHSGGFSQMLVRNSILWGNTDDAAGTVTWTDEIDSLTSVTWLDVDDSLVFEYTSDPGGLGDRILCGEPGFVAGGAPYLLSIHSRCVDYGADLVDTIYDYRDLADLDDDGLLLELTPDLLLEDRVAPIGAMLPDLGAIEVQEGCPSDLDLDQVVGFEDLLILLASWTEDCATLPPPAPCDSLVPCAADLDGDEDVDFEDLLVMLANWGPCPCVVNCPQGQVDDLGSVQKCIERVGLDDPEKLAACIEAMMLMGTP